LSPEFKLVWTSQVAVNLYSYINTGVRRQVSEHADDVERVKVDKTDFKSNILL
jgi:hypothetical protein